MLLLMLMVMMTMMVMVTMLQGQVGGHHLAGGPGHGAIVEGVVRHAVLGPAGRLAEMLLVTIANNVASFHSFLGAIK